VRGAAGEIALDLTGDGREASDDGAGYRDEPEDQCALNSVDLFAHLTYFPSDAADLSPYRLEFVLHLDSHAANLGFYSVEPLVDLFEAAIDLVKPLVDLNEAPVNLVKPLVDLNEALIYLFEALVYLFEALVYLFEAAIDLAAEVIEPPVCPFLNHCLHDDATLARNVLSVVELRLKIRHNFRAEARQ
jgi:hypothetical protein